MGFAAKAYEGSVNAVIVPRGPGRNIPAAAAETMAHAIGAIAPGANDLGDDLSATFHNMLMYDLKSLGDSKTGQALRAYLIAMLKNGWRGASPDLQMRLAHLFQMGDDMVQADLGDYAAALGVRD